MRGDGRDILINVDRLSDAHQEDNKLFCQLYFGHEDSQVKVHHSLDEIMEMIKSAEMELIIDKTLRAI
jgi:hypothetical protein